MILIKDYEVVDGNRALIDLGENKVYSSAVLFDQVKPISSELANVEEVIADTLSYGNSCISIGMSKKVKEVLKLPLKNFSQLLGELNFERNERFYLAEELVSARRELVSVKKELIKEKKDAIKSFIIFIVFMCLYLWEILCQ